MIRQKPLKRSQKPLKRTPIIRKPKKKREYSGKYVKPEKESKTQEWDRIREELKIKFIEMGINYCELRYPKCTGSLHWTFAHSLKRNDMSAEPEQRYIDIREVIYACQNCHGIIEARGNKDLPDGSPKMKDIVRTTIAKR